MTSGEAFLIERGPDGAERRHPLSAPDTVLGRAPDCDVVLQNPRVSRRHAVIRRRDDGFVLRDLGSTNGTWLDGAPVHAEQPLPVGAAFRLADTDLWLQEGLDAATEVHVRETPEMALAPAARAVLVRGVEVALTPKEYALLDYLAQQRGTARPRAAIAAAVWPEFQGDASRESLDQLVARVRRKIERNPGAPRLLKTVRGYGYRLEVG